jgi:hypothetical protein
LLASSAPPSPFLRPRGIPRRTFVAITPPGFRRTTPPRASLLGSGPLQSSSGLAPARSSRHGVRPPSGTAGPSLMRFFAPGRNDDGCPFSVTVSLAVARAGRRSPDLRRCRPQGSCPSRRFQLPCARRSSSLPAITREEGRSALVLERPSRAFPPRGAVSALADLCSLAGSLSDCRRRSAFEGFTTAFTCRASSSPREPTRRRTRDS